MHLHPTLIVEQVLKGTNKAPASVREQAKSNQGRKASVQSLSLSHLEQEGTPLVEKSKGAEHHFFSLTDGS